MVSPWLQPDRARLATLIRQGRERRNWSRRQLAERLTVSVLAITRWERGDSAPQPKFTQLLLDALDLTQVERAELSRLQQLEWRSLEG